MGIYITTPRDEYFEYKHVTGANQTAKFQDDGIRGSLYNLQLTILDHAKPVVNLQGRVVHETVLAIIDQSTKYHLRLVKDAVDARLEEME